MNVIYLSIFQKEQLDTFQLFLFSLIIYSELFDLIICTNNELEKELKIISEKFEVPFELLLTKFDLYNIPEKYSKVLYLDTNIIVQRNLKNLFDIELEDRIYSISNILLFNNKKNLNNDIKCNKLSKYINLSEPNKIPNNNLIINQFMGIDSNLFLKCRLKYHLLYLLEVSAKNKIVNNLVKFRKYKWGTGYIFFSNNNILNTSWGNGNYECITYYSFNLTWGGNDHTIIFNKSFTKFVSFLHKTVFFDSFTELVPKVIIVKSNPNGFCNVLISLLSAIRVKNKIKCDKIIINDIKLNNIFDFDKTEDRDEESFYFNSWRLKVFDSDKNLDKIINNNFSIMYPYDDTDCLYFQSFNNNFIDFIYRPDLFNDIYQEYANIFNSLKIKEVITNKINDFYKKNFNNNTISVHIRSWTDAKDREKLFDLNKFYNKIEEFNYGTTKFFIASDNINLCYDIKKKYGDKIIIYEEESPYKDFIELILLSKNNILIGTYISTFTQMAYLINYNSIKKIYIL